MNRLSFKKKLKEVGLSQKKFANITGYAYSTVKGWEDTPKWVSVVLEYVEVIGELSQINESLKRVSLASIEINNKVQIPDFLVNIKGKK